LGFISTQNRHPQRGKGDFSFSCGNENITTHRTWKIRNYVRRKDNKIFVSSEEDTSKKR
jgi:hypothetical protein